MSVAMSAVGGRADWAVPTFISAFDPKRHLHEAPRGLESKRLARELNKWRATFIGARSRSAHLRQT